jgi:ribosomal protein S18 acetylase RimI-like enzyme
MPNVDIRPVAIGDVEGVRACVGAVGAEGVHLAFTEPFTVTETALYIARLIDGGYPNAVALAEGEVIGWCDIMPKAGGVHRHVGVLGMGVAKPHRGCGIGLRLIRAALEAARSRWEQVELSVYATNLPAQSLYRKVGFVERGRLPKGRKANGRYDDVILMSILFGNEP